VLKERYQVLLDDWLAEYIKFLAERYDLNSSTVIRAHICLAILSTLPALSPEYKPNLANKEVLEIAKKAAKDELEELDVHRILSKILYEARKAVEFRLSKRK